MTKTDDVLAAIDTAVRDWSVGPDAVRTRPDRHSSSQGGAWMAPTGTPEPEPGESLPHQWQPITYVAVAEPPRLHVDPEAAQRFFSGVGEALNAVAEAARPLVEARARFIVELGNVLRPVVEAQARAFTALANDPFVKQLVYLHTPEGRAEADALQRAELHRIKTSYRRRARRRTRR